MIYITQYAVLLLRAGIKATNIKETDKEKTAPTEDEIIRHLAGFVSRLWQIHVFGEGNTRTTAAFFIKYLRTLVFDLFSKTDKGKNRRTSNMSYFKNITVGEMCVWRNEIIRFDPDSSPSAWTHYRTIYEGRIEGYDFSRLSFYIRYSEFGDLNRCFCGERNIWLNYIDLPSPDSRDYNRLFALKNDTVRIEKEGVTYIEPAYRYGGECDFNFNQEKYTDFKAFIGGDAYALDRLEKCRAKHHTLINFSLMQALGNMQGVKGEEDYDRLDVFIHKLNQYFEGSPDEVVCSAGRNREFLEKYLHGFRDIYDYCEKIYFIDNKEFVDEIIRQGALPIAGCRDVIRYMDLADEFWRRKRIKIEEIYRKRS